MSVLPEVTQKVETDLIKVHAGIVEFDRVDFPLVDRTRPFGYATLRNSKIPRFCYRWPRRNVELDAQPARLD